MAKFGVLPRQRTRVETVLVPVSMCVYAVYLLLLFCQRYGAACGLLGLAIYASTAISALLGGGLPVERAGIFGFVNVIALTSYVYIAFMQHALRRRLGLDPQLVPSLPSSAETTFFGSQPGLVVLVIAGYSLLYSSAKALHTHVFEGRLSSNEREQITERTAAFIASKVVLLAVLEPDMLETVMWLSWFSLLGFLRVIARLVCLRLAECASQPDRRRRVRRLAALAHTLLGSALFWLGVAVLFCCTAGTGGSTLLLLVSDCALLVLQALACIGHHRTLRSSSEWEERRETRHKTELVHDALGGVLAIAQHAHTLLLKGLAGTMLDLFLLVGVYAEVAILAQRLREHCLFVDRTRELRGCPLASVEELSHFDDHCAVCLEALLPAPVSSADVMQTSTCCARRLVCGHIFHSVCLSAWLEQHRTCPTCRAPTSIDARSAQQPDIRLGRPSSESSALEMSDAPAANADLGLRQIWRCATRFAPETLDH